MKIGCILFFLPPLFLKWSVSFHINGILMSVKYKKLILIHVSIYLMIQVLVCIIFPSRNFKIFVHTLHLPPLFMGYFLCRYQFSLMESIKVNLLAITKQIINIFITRNKLRPIFLSVKLIDELRLSQHKQI